MTFGEKLREARNESGLSQEQFAAKINISRSAVAKWENNNGMPDINNLKVISKLLGVSIDYLLDDDTVLSLNENNDDSSNVESFSEYEGYYCDIELNGWNDGVSKVQLLGRDDTFIYYRRFEKNKPVIGMIGKKYVVSINQRKEIQNNLKEIQNNLLECETNDVLKPITIDTDYFTGKHVSVEVACKEGIVKGFLDFKNDDYMDVVVKAFDNNKVEFEYGDDVLIDSITKMEEIV